LESLYRHDIITKHADKNNDIGSAYFSIINIRNSSRDTCSPSRLEFNG